MDKNTNEYSPNVALIRGEGIRIIRATIPRDIRNELMRGVKTGALGWLRKDRLKPEIFYRPDQENEAMQQQINQALHAIKCLAKIIHIGE